MASMSRRGGRFEFPAASEGGSSSQVQGFLDRAVRENSDDPQEGQRSLTFAERAPELHRERVGCDPDEARNLPRAGAAVTVTSRAFARPAVEGSPIPLRR